MNVVFRQTAPKEGCYGDFSADYAVKLDSSCTVREFLKWVISERNNEWGCIGVVFREKGWAQFCKVKCEYRWGKMVSRLPEKYLDMTIKKVTGHGGWSNMDYVLVVKGGAKMRASKLLAKAVRLMEEYMNADWYDQIHMSFPPPPYRERLHPRKDYQRRLYWRRTRSNPHRRSYH